MGSRKQKHLKKNRPKQSQGGVAGPTSMPVLQPKPWPSAEELPEDSALFNSEAEQLLSEALRTECAAVKSALELVEIGQAEQASTSLQGIARQSPYADWRLFIRGLTDFYQQSYDEANQAWSRLTVTRRPARIACVLLDAVGQTRPESLADVSVSAEALPVARQTLDRTNIVAEAKKILAARHRNRHVSFSMAQASMLRGFGDRFRRIDHAFAQRFMQACVYASSNQGDREVFSVVSAFTPGPNHDPRWLLIDLFRCLDGDDDPAENMSLLKRYTEEDLRKCTGLTDAAKGALTSLLLTRIADCSHACEIDSYDFQSRLEILKTAVEACPTNRAAHDAGIDLIQNALELDDVPLKSMNRLQEHKLEAVKQFAHDFPNDGEVAYDLAKAYMQCDRFDDAARQAQRAIDLRVDSPEAKALPWEIKLHQAMHAARSKVSFHLTDAILDEAIAVWPTWLCRDWVPFLKAAVAIRNGNTEGFQGIVSQAIMEGKIPKLTGALMTYLALQKFSLPAKTLKGFRDELDEQVALVKLTTAEDLIRAGSFLWDLDRTGVIGEGMIKREKSIGEAIIHRANSVDFTTPHGEACFCWLAGNDFFDAGPTMKVYATTPRLAMAYVDCICINGKRSDLDVLPELLDVIEKGLATESDPWYREEMLSIRDAAKDYLAANDEPSDFEAFSSFARTFAAQMGLDLDELDLPPGLRAVFGQAEDEDLGTDEDEFFEDDEDDLDNYEGKFNTFHQGGAPEVRSPTAEERKAFDKFRKKELDRAKKHK